MQLVNGERRYNVWAGNPKGRAEDPAYCVEEIQESGRGGLRRQCDRKRGFGPDGLYCKRHAENFLDKPVATYYRTGQYTWEIVEVPVFKESAKTILIKSGGGMSNTAKMGYYNYYPTRQEAVEQLRARLNAMRKNLAEAEKQFAKIEK